MADRAGRRDARSFEPPPWEQAHFDELEKLKTVEPEAAVDACPDALNVPDTHDAASAGGAGDVVVKPPQVDRKVPPVDEAAMLEMMSRLAADEPPVVRSIWQLAMVASIVLGSIGLMMIVFGAVGLARTARTGLTAVLGGATLISFGIGMIALAVWMAVRTLKQRGVL